MAEVRAVRGDAEVDRVARLTARQLYAPEDHDEVSRLVAGGLRDGTFARRELCGVYTDDRGELSATLRALDLQLHIGQAPVRTVGFSGLAVEPSQWGRDCAQRLMDLGREVVRAGGFNLVVGVGIPHYYDRWGAAPVAVECVARLDVRRVRGTVARPFRAATSASVDVEHLTSLHAEANQGRTGLVHRTAAMWRWSPRAASFLQVRDDAFFGFEVAPGELRVIDVGACSPGAYRDVVLASCAEARARGLPAVALVVAPDHELLRAAIPHGVTVKLSYPQTGHWMARILDLRRFFDELRPELLRRLRRVAGPRVALRLSSGEEATELDLDGGGPGLVSVSLDLPIRDLTQLVFGYRAIDEVLLERGLQRDPAAVGALELLFPRGYAHVWPVPW